MIEIQEKTLSLICCVAFGMGVLLGYDLKGKRIKYLKWKRDMLVMKANETVQKIQKETASMV